MKDLGTWAVRIQEGLNNTVENEPRAFHFFTKANALTNRTTHKTD